MFDFLGLNHFICNKDVIVLSSGKKKNTCKKICHTRGSERRLTGPNSGQPLSLYIIAKPRVLCAPQGKYLSQGGSCKLLGCLTALGKGRRVYKEGDFALWTEQHCHTVVLSGVEGWMPCCTAVMKVAVKEEGGNSTYQTRPHQLGKMVSLVFLLQTPSLDICTWTRRSGLTSPGYKQYF